tara:strand:- start:40656 stop:41012 length:357 start_codon:yes stop_codon:yes gene_type:complete
MAKAAANDLIINDNSTQHTVETPHGDIDVWIRDLSWIERQEALGQFVKLAPDASGEMTPTIDFGGYWRFVYKRCITRTDPELDQKQLLSLRPEVGAAIQELLPGFEDLMAGMNTGPLA